MKGRTLIILGYIITAFLIFNNSDAQRLKSLNNKNSVKKDTVYISDYRNITYNATFSKKDLTDILSTKNTTENALSIFITALGVLFTIMAIVVAIVIFMQSRDFKNKLTEATDKYQLIIKQFIDAKREDLKIQEENITKLISDYREKLEMPEPEPDSQPAQESENKIKEIINVLEHKKNIIEKQLNNSIVDVNYVAGSYFHLGKPSSLPNKHHQCSNCKFGFLVHNPDSGIDAPSATSMHYFSTSLDSPNTNKVVICPKCGNVDVIN